MDLRLLYAIILTILPITELRAGLPLAIIFARDNNISILLIFLIIVIVNILTIFFVFYFLDKIHLHLLKIKIYNKFFSNFIKRFQRKVHKFEKRYDTIGFLALSITVAVPLPGTGIWTGSLISWLLGLNRKKSIIAMSIGVLIAGLLVLLGTLQILGMLGYS
ncbi:small multi-drug export protein [Patescibacteria group bacterium]|nr:small multi-drug export protein [Patescibacteria group bacterium]